MKETPNPTLLDFMVWKKEIGASLWEVVRIAEAEVSDVIKQRANGECLVGHGLSRLWAGFSNHVISNNHASTDGLLHILTPGSTENTQTVGNGMI